MTKFFKETLTFVSMNASTFMSKVIGNFQVTDIKRCSIYRTEKRAHTADARTTFSSKVIKEKCEERTEITLEDSDPLFHRLKHTRAYRIFGDIIFDTTPETPPSNPFLSSSLYQLLLEIMTIQSFRCVFVLINILF